MFTYLADAWFHVTVANNQAISTATTTNSTIVDISNAVGPILITIIGATGGTGTLNFTPQMNTANSTSGAIAVPAAALVTYSGASTGAAATFPAMTSTAYDQTLAVINELSQRYLYLAMVSTGGSVAQTVTALIHYLKRYTQ